MNGYLRQNTSSQVRTIGPFVDDTDFKTLRSALTIANTDIKLKKNGAASANKNSGGATADGTNGWYQVTWDATDTATVGELSVSVKVAGALVYFGTYVVLEEAVYDSMFAASATGYVSDTTRASQASVDTLATYVDTEVAAIKTKTDQLTFTGGKVDANATTAIVAGDLIAIADAILKRDWAAISGEAVYSLLNAARMLRNVWGTSGGTLTVKKEDGTTTAWTRTLSTDPNAQPITGAS
jgi:hypothetical protein